MLKFKSLIFAATSLSACVPQGVPADLTAAAFDVPQSETLAWTSESADIAQSPTPPGFFLAVDSPFLYGGSSSLSVSGLPAGETVRVLYSFNGVQNGPCLPMLGGNCLNIGAPLAPLPGSVPSGGLASLAVNVPATSPQPYIALQAVALPSGQVSNVVAFPISPTSSGVTPTSDVDGDGTTFLQGDCADDNPGIGPTVAGDTVGDLIDQNCDGADGVDLDGDGDAGSASGGTDCNDFNAAVSMGAAEVCDGFDNTCNGEVDAVGGVSVCAPPMVETYSYTTSSTDILFTLDRSCSMADEQVDLSLAAADLLQPLFDKNADLHIGVITTDMTDPTQSGRLQAVGPDLFADSANMTPSEIIAWLETAAVAGTSGSAIEKGLAAVASALTPPLAITDNAGFLRPDAHLAIVHLSDEDDQSGPSVSVFAGALHSVKAGTPYSTQVFAIRGPGPGTPGCGAMPGNRFDVMVGFFPGNGYNICDDFGPSALDLGFRSSEPVQGDVFTLTAAVDQSTLTIEVATPSGSVSLLGPNDWFYNAANSTVQVTAPLVPGSDVTISYQTP